MPVDLTGATKAPPRKSATPRTNVRQSARTEAAPSQTVQNRFRGLQGVGQGLQIACAMGRQYADAGAIGMYWDGIAQQTAELAETNVWVAKVADTLIQAGPLAGLVAAVAPLALQIMANHNVVDPGSVASMGVVHPDTLSAQIRAGMAKQAVEALQAQQQAEEMLRHYEESLAQSNSSMGNGGVNGHQPFAQE
jgi:hypothetical protein